MFPFWVWLCVCWVWLTSDPQARRLPRRPPQDPDSPSLSQSPSLPVAHSRLAPEDPPPLRRHPAVAAAEMALNFISLDAMVPGAGGDVSRVALAPSPAFSPEARRSSSPLFGTFCSQAHPRSLEPSARKLIRCRRTWSGARVFRYRADGGGHLERRRDVILARRGALAALLGIN